MKNVTLSRPYSLDEFSQTFGVPPGDLDGWIESGALVAGVIVGRPGLTGDFPPEAAMFRIQYYLHWADAGFVVRNRDRYYPFTPFESLDAVARAEYDIEKAVKRCSLFLQIRPRVTRSGLYVFPEAWEQFKERHDSGVASDGKPERQQKPVGRRDSQIDVILAVAKELGYNPKSIPYGGKTEIDKKCQERHPHLFAENSFGHAWKKAKDRELVEVENVESYKKIGSFGIAGV